MLVGARVCFAVLVAKALGHGRAHGALAHQVGPVSAGQAVSVLPRVGDRAGSLATTSRTGSSGRRSICALCGRDVVAGVLRVVAVGRGRSSRAICPCTMVDRAGPRIRVSSAGCWPQKRQTEVSQKLDKSIDADFGKDLKY